MKVWTPQAFCRRNVIWRTVPETNCRIYIWHEGTVYSCSSWKVWAFADMLPRFVRPDVSVVKDVLAFCHLTFSLLFLPSSVFGGLWPFSGYGTDFVRNKVNLVPTGLRRWGLYKSYNLVRGNHLFSEVLFQILLDNNNVSIEVYRISSI